MKHIEYEVISRENKEGLRICHVVLVSSVEVELATSRRNQAREQPEMTTYQYNQRKNFENYNVW